jgi:hypothetical protein
VAKIDGPAVGAVVGALVTPGVGDAVVPPHAATTNVITEVNKTNLGNRDIAAS